MATLTLRSSYSKNSGLVISAPELRKNFLAGLTTVNPLINKAILDFSDTDIEFHIRAAQKEIENYLAIKLVRQLYSENMQFDNDAWKHWGYIPTSFPVVTAVQLQGFLNTTLQATYPAEWLTNKRESSDEQYFRQIFMVPANNTGVVVNTAAYAGLLPNLGYLGSTKIPFYWTATYATGFARNKIPFDLIQAIGSMATINMLYILGVNILGFPGLSSTSISIDGLSQSMSTQLNAYGSRIKMMADDLARKMAMFKDVYTGFRWTAM